MSRLPDGWSLERFGDHIELAQNGFSRRVTEVDDGHIVLRIANITSSQIDLTQVTRYEMTDEELNTYRLKSGDLLFVRVNGSEKYIGRCALVLDERYVMAFDENIIRLRPTEAFDSKFLFYLLNSPKIRTRLIADINWSTGGQYTISQPILKAQLLPLPPLPEQRKIAQILSTWDEAIALVEALIAALKRRKQGLMQRLLIHRHEVPDGWRRVRLREFLSKRNEWIILDDDSEYKRCTVKLHNIGVLPRDVVKGSELRTKRQQVTREGDLIVAEIDAKVGGFGIIKADTAGSIVSSHYYLYEIDPELSTDFLEQCIFAGLLQQQVDAIGSTNYAAIRPSDVLSYQIPFPPQEEREAITNLLVSCDQLAAVYQGYCTQLREH